MRVAFFLIGLLAFTLRAGSILDLLLDDEVHQLRILLLKVLNLLLRVSLIVQTELVLSFYLFLKFLHHRLHVVNLSVQTFEFSFLLLTL